MTTFGTPADTGVTPETGVTGDTGVTQTGVTAETGVTADTGVTGATPATAATGLVAAPTDGGPLKVGQAFGPRYHIIKLLGAGGMGAVYQAWDAELNVAVALKVIRVGSRRAAAEQEKRFKTELLLARSVTHKNVVRIHDLGAIDGTKYITMSYVQGADLATLLRTTGKFPIDRALQIARQIAAGLGAAHEAGVVHRDLKPANVMLGADDLALIMDFGISASADDAADGGIVGTLEYMAPEQAKGQADARADVYAFGLVLYELLTGPRPVADPTPQARITAMQQRCAEGVASVRTVDPSIPAPLADLITQCVATDPAARFANGADVADALGLLDDRGERIPIARRLTKRMIAATAVSVAVLVGAAFYTARRLSAPVKPHDPVSVVIADIENSTGDSAFDHTLEPTVRRALEGASFINAAERTRINSAFGVRPPTTLDEAAAREIALKQGLNVVLAGSIGPQRGGYRIALKATQAVTGQLVASVQGYAAGKDKVLETATTLVTTVRKALGDKTSSSAQLFAMRKISTTSFDAVHYYALGAEAISNGKLEEAQQSFAKSVQLDPNFGLGYQALASVYRNQGKIDDSDKYIKEALRHLDAMTDRERLGTRGLYDYLTADYPQCVNEYTELIGQSGADGGGYNMRALCLSKLRNMPRAVDDQRHATQILPKRLLWRGNLSIYADYSSDFPTAEREATAVGPPTDLMTLALAFAKIGQGQLPQADEAYRKLASVSKRGVSWSASGLADLALYQGHLADAVRLFQQGAAADLADNNKDRAARKLTSLGFAELQRGQNDRALAAADAALTDTKSAEARLLAARIYVEANAIDRARTVAAGLAAELPAEPQAYANIIEGEIALKAGDARRAIKALTDANAVLDTWLGRFDLGRAYLLAGAFPQADSQFDSCIKRRGEAMAMFVDEEPTFGYFPMVYYYQGRVREGLNNPGFAESYREYLKIRGESTEDRLVPEVRKRATS